MFTVSVILRTNPIISEKLAEKGGFKRKILKESSNSTTLHLTIGLEVKTGKMKLFAL